MSMRSDVAGTLRMDQLRPYARPDPGPEVANGNLHEKLHGKLRGDVAYNLIRRYCRGLRYASKAIPDHRARRTEGAKVHLIDVVTAILS